MGDIQMLGLSGAPTQLARAPSTPSDPVDVAGAAESADGAHWVYSVISGSGSSSGTVTSSIYAGPIGGAMSLAATLSRPNIANGGYGGGYRVLRWDAGGVLLGTDPQNVGGVGPFIGDEYSLASVVRLDPANGALSTPLDCGGRGRFGDVAADGTQACAANGGVVILRPDGSVQTIAGSEADSGQIAFAGGSAAVIWCTSPGMGATQLPDGAEWTDTLYHASLHSGQVTRQAVASADDVRFESRFAFNRVVDDHTVAELTGAPATSLTLVDLPTGRLPVVAPAVDIVGVL